MTGHISGSGSEVGPSPDLNTRPTPDRGPVDAVLKIVGILALFFGMFLAIVQLIDYIVSGKAKLILVGITAGVAVLGVVTIWILRARPGVLTGAGLTLGTGLALGAVTVFYPALSDPENDPALGCSGNLLVSPWRLEASHGASERYMDFTDSNVLAGKSIARVTYDLHGLRAGEGPRKDQSALIFNQPTWYVVSFANYGENGSDGEQTVDFPLNDFIGLPDAESGAPGGTRLDTSRPVDAVRVRIWHYEPYIVDISSIRLCG